MRACESQFDIWFDLLRELVISICNKFVRFSFNYLLRRYDLYLKISLWFNHECDFKKSEKV
jgi:hypothetical protein